MNVVFVTLCRFVSVRSLQAALPDEWADITVKPQVQHLLLRVGDR